MNRLLLTNVLSRWWIPALIYGIILAGSSVPGKKIPYVFQLTPDKMIHFIEYFVFSFFLARVLVTIPRLTRRQIIWICGAMAMGAALVDESYQSLIPGRHPDYHDWLIDVAGGLAGAGVLLFWWRKLKRENLSR